MGELDSFLIEITADILKYKEQGETKFLVQKIRDSAGQVNHKLNKLYKHPCHAGCSAMLDAAVYLYGNDMRVLFTVCVCMCSCVRACAGRWRAINTGFICGYP